MKIKIVKTPHMKCWYYEWSNNYGTWLRVLKCYTVTQLHRYLTANLKTTITLLHFSTHYILQITTVKTHTSRFCIFSASYINSLRAKNFVFMLDIFIFKDQKIDTIIRKYVFLTITQTDKKWPYLQLALF